METVLHSFGAGKDGVNPLGPLTPGPSGRFYGTTSYGGNFRQGTAFVLVEAGGAWKEAVLHSFQQGVPDTGQPGGGVVLDSAGNLYGVGHQGGSLALGGVYEIVP